MFKQEIILLKFNKDVVCTIDKDQFPVCTPVVPAGRRNNNPNIPSYDPYIPRSHSVFYNCTDLTCEPIRLLSLTQVTSPNLKLKACFQHSPGKFDCEPIRYNYFKNLDKLLFLRSNIQNKTFYLVDCLIYLDKGRVCHVKDEDIPLTVGLNAIAAKVRPKEDNVLSQEEFLCEESDIKQINCDLDPFVPFDDGLRLKQFVAISGDILLKSGTYAVILKRNCVDSWCGYSGSVTPTRRGWFERYDPPGGKTFRCYMGKRQQICKLIIDDPRSGYSKSGRTYS